MQTRTMDTTTTQDEEVEQMQTRVQVITVMVGTRTAALIECSACGPVAVDSTVVNATLLGANHLLLAHSLQVGV